VSLPSSANQPAPKQRINVYTVMLIMSACALVLASTFMVMELAKFGFPGSIPWSTAGGS
jgi:hypothetical protein